MPIIQIRQTPPITIDSGGTAEISGAGSQAVMFEGATGTLKLDDASAFTGPVTGLTGSDAIDLADISYGANTKATFSGNANGGTLTVTNGTQTANIALVGNYLTSGWTLSSDGHGGTVVVDPPSTFPNATNTGIPAGTALKVYTGPSTITTNGAVLNGYIFTSQLTIDANNVTIENCSFQISGANSNCINIQDPVSTVGTVITHCEFAGANGGDAIFASNCTISYCNIHGYAKDIYCQGSNVTATNNYLWDIQSSGEHAENVFIDGLAGTTLTNCNFSNNAIVCNENTANVAGTFFISSDFGPVSNITINNNLLVDGGYTLFYGLNPPSVTDINVTNNVIGAGKWGYAYGTVTGTGSSWSGNVDFTTGQVVSASGGNTPSPQIDIASFTPSNSFTDESATFGQNIATANVITLTGSTSANDTVNIYDGNTLLGQTKTDASGVWHFTTPTLANGTHAFTAHDTAAATTSATFDVTVGAGSPPPPPAPPPAAPVLSSDAVNSDNSVTLNGAGEANSTVTVFDGSTNLGNVTVNSSGAFTYTTAAEAAGSSHTFTATDTDANGTSDASNALTVTIPSSGGGGGSSNVVTNGDFATGDFSGWTLGGNNTGPQVYVNSQAESGQYAAALGSVGSDGTLSQTLQTTAGQQYSLTFWLANNGSGPDDFTAKWNGATVLALTNAPAQGYTEYTFTVTATGSTSTLEFDARQDPSHWNLDNISVTANGTSSTTAPAAPVIGTAAVNPNTDPTVTLTGTAPDGSTVTVSDGGSIALGTTTASSTGTWSFTTPDLPAGTYAFTATDTTSAGTSTTSSPFDLTVPPPSSPTLDLIAESPASGDLNAGKTVTLTLNLSESVTVNTAGGTPTLTLNDGGTATYTSGSGSALTFSYTVGASDRNVASLSATTINLNGATITDGAGNTANLSLTGLTQTGPQIDTTTPVISSVAESPSSGDLNAGKTVTYTITMSGNSNGG